MAALARIGSEPYLPVTSKFANKPVKFDTFLNALKAHYDKDEQMPSYAEMAISILRKANTKYCEGKLVTPQQQNLIERKIQELLPSKRTQESKAVEISEAESGVNNYTDQDKCATLVVFMVAYVALTIFSITYSKRFDMF